MNVKTIKLTLALLMGCAVMVHDNSPFKLYRRAYHVKRNSYINNTQDSITKPLIIHKILSRLEATNRSRNISNQSLDQMVTVAGTKPKVCILIPVSSRKQDWKRLEDTFLYRMALRSLANTTEPEFFSYTVFVGYDTGDLFFDNQTTLESLEKWMKTEIPFVSLATRSFVNELSKPGPMMNFLSREAYNTSCDFLYRINDDTEFLTPWTSAFVNALHSFTPAMHGVVGPTCHEGNTMILTHDFVHRSHLDLFPTHYPPELTDWWLDDWITYVYGEQNTRKLPEVVVKHHVLSTRYEVKWESEKILNSLLEQGRLRISRALNLKVIAYSLYGNNPRYTDGAMANAKLITEFFPGWTMRVYHDKSVPETLLKYLRDHNVELVDMSDDPLKNQMVWRFLPAGEANVERFTSRDVDARLSAREAAAVKEWVDSGLPFHVMRDHPSHNNHAVSGGMWGSKGGAIKDIRERLLEGRLADHYMVDMDFLNSQIWPIMSEAGVMVHDAFSCDRPKTQPFPTTRQGSEHVGSVYIDGAVRQVDADILLNAIAQGKPGCADEVESMTSPTESPKKEEIHVALPLPPRRIDVCMSNRNGSQPASHEDMLRLFARDAHKLPADMISTKWVDFMCPGIRFDSERQAIFERVYASAMWTHGDASVPLSGSGSTLAGSAGAREAIRRVILDHNVRSIVDIPCGDLTWMPAMFPFFREHNVTYTGIDIVPALIENHRKAYPEWTFHQLDYVKQEMPIQDVALIFNREALQHVNFYDVFLALHHFSLVQSAKFLLTTSYEVAENDNLAWVDGASNTLIQLDKSPYFFKPMASYEDGRPGGINRMKLFRLPLVRNPEQS